MQFSEQKMKWSLGFNRNAQKPDADKSIQQPDADIYKCQCDGNDQFKVSKQTEKLCIYNRIDYIITVMQELEAGQSVREPRIQKN